jgi:hypothetical protein
MMPKLVTQPMIDAPERFPLTFAGQTRVPRQKKKRSSKCRNPDAYRACPVAIFAPDEAASLITPPQIDPPDMATVLIEQD